MFRYILFCFLIGGIACSDTETNMIANHDAEALKYFNIATKASGELERWNNITELTFVKNTRMFLPDSSLEMEVLQKQTFRNYPSFYGEIEYLFDEKERRIIQDSAGVKYFENGKEIEDEEAIEKAATNIKTAFYVIGLPFKLADKGPTFKSLNVDTLMDERIVNTIHIQHVDEDQKQKDEDWWVYFSRENDQMIGYLIRHDNRYSYILNDSTTIVNGFPFPVLRRSIAMDNNKDNIYLRADYQYSDISIKTSDE